ncbi:hypothetical protein [Azospirillum endophyticum]
MIDMVRNLREANVDDSKSQPHDEKSGADKSGRTADCTHYGQAAGSPGGRGGTTCYGGIQRVQPRTATAGTPSPDKDRDSK